jgi:hypothetical protein
VRRAAKLRTRWPRHDASSCRPKVRERRSDRLCRPIWAATEDMDFVWYFSGRRLCPPALLRPERCLPGRRGAARNVVPSSEPRAPPAADLGAAGWVIRRPLVPMARVALLSVACEGEPAARHQVRPRPHLIAAGPNPASLRRCGRCARRGYPTAHRREPARARVLLCQGLYRLTDTVQTKERTPTFDLRAGAVIDGSDGGFIGISRPDGQGLGAKILGGSFSTSVTRRLRAGLSAHRA